MIDFQKSTDNVDFQLRLDALLKRERLEGNGYEDQVMEMQSMSML